MVAFGCLCVGSLAHSLPGQPETALYAVSSSVPMLRNLSEQEVSIRLFEGRATFSFQCEENLKVYASGEESALTPGAYTVRVLESTPAEQVFHLFSKTFRPDEARKERKYVTQMTREGFEPRIVEIGTQFRTASGTILDTRLHWISMLRMSTEESAKAKKAELTESGQWTWMQSEIVRPGSAEVEMVASDGTVHGPFKTPLELSSEGPVLVQAVEVGFWDGRRADQSYTGRLQVSVDTIGALTLTEYLRVEAYLAGVLPAEMPSEWSAEALKAQAVAARSEVLVNLGAKHRLEGFDFCGVEHCRAYLGSQNEYARAATAVRDTAGTILTQGVRIVPTVFSANCGGWTEHNDTVWFGPPQDALRGVSDLSFEDDKSVQPAYTDISEWLHTTPDAYCNADEQYFRWTQSYSQKKLSAIVNERHPVGEIQSIELGERGVSGRLKWVRIVGAKATETIRKELPIRKAFGGLPSAMFILEQGAADNGTWTITFVGGGRGHGVGMCQNGAQGMALAGRSYTEILRHYFSNVNIERYN